MSYKNSRKAILSTKCWGSVTYRFFPRETSVLVTAPVTFLGENHEKFRLSENVNILNPSIQSIQIQHFRKCIYILSTFVCSLSGPDLARSVLLYFYTQNNASGASAESKKVRDVSRGGGSPEERPYDVSRVQNRYVTLPLN